MKIDNYNGSKNYKPTPAQQRVLDRFSESRQLPAHCDHWQRYDQLPLQALIRRGFIRRLIGPYENHYLRTHKAISSPNIASEPRPGARSA
jgi:hypothetical protein